MAFSHCCSRTKKAVSFQNSHCTQFWHWVCLSWTTKRKDTCRWMWLPECHAEKWHSKGNLSTALDGRQAWYFRAPTALPFSYEGITARMLPNFKTTKITSDTWQTTKSLNLIHSFHYYEDPNQYKIHNSLGRWKKVWILS